MHKLCQQVSIILANKCLQCKKNILDNNIFIYIDDNQLNNIITNYNNCYFEKSVHLECINMIHLLKIIKNEKYDIITENIFNKIKQQEYNKEVIDKILYSNCFLCNKKKFRAKLNKYSYEDYMLYLKNIKILEIKKNIFYKHYDIDDKTYAYLCNNCNNRIVNHSFYNEFFFDNLEKIHLSEKQTNILTKIKQFCIN
jgi:hypothetical protein